MFEVVSDQIPAACVQLCAVEVSAETFARITSQNRDLLVTSCDDVTFVDSRRSRENIASHVISACVVTQPDLGDPCPNVQIGPCPFGGCARVHLGVMLACTSAISVAGGGEKYGDFSIGNTFAG